MDLISIYESQDDVGQMNCVDYTDGGYRDGYDNTYSDVHQESNSPTYQDNGQL